MNELHKPERQGKTCLNSDLKWGGEAAKKARELTSHLVREGFSIAFVRRVGLSMTVLTEKD